MKLVRSCLLLGNSVLILPLLQLQFSLTRRVGLRFDLALRGIGPVGHAIDIRLEVRHLRSNIFQAASGSRHQRAALDLRLSDQQAVEGIAMVPWEMLDDEAGMDAVETAVASVRGTKAE